jgi:hypothetical protein
VNGQETIQEYGQSFSSKELQLCPGTLISEVAALKEQFPGSTVASGSLTIFDDLATHPDDIPVKKDNPTKAEARRKTSAAVEAMKRFGETR